MAAVKTKLHTDRLELTLFNKDDAYHLESLRRIQRLVAEEVYKSPTLDADVEESMKYSMSKGFVTVNGQSLGRLFFYLITEKANPGEFVGLISMIQRIPIPDIGWATIKEFRRKGYASEAAAEVLRYCTDELGLTEIYATTALDNVTSQNICKKIGLERAPTTIRSNTRDGLELACWILPGMKPFPQGWICLRRGDSSPLLPPDHAE